MDHIFDFEPFSKGRMVRILQIWEAAYKYRRLPSAQQTKEAKYKFLAEYEMDNSEAGTFLQLIRDFSFQEIRRYLLDNGSSLVRVGKKTRPPNA